MTPVVNNDALKAGVAFLNLPGNATVDILATTRDGGGSQIRQTQFPSPEGPQNEAVVAKVLEIDLQSCVSGNQLTIGIRGALQDAIATRNHRRASAACHCYTCRLRVPLGDG